MDSKENLSNSAVAATNQDIRLTRKLIVKKAVTEDLQLGDNWLVPDSEILVRKVMPSLEDKGQKEEGSNPSTRKILFSWNLFCKVFFYDQLAGKFVH